MEINYIKISKCIAVSDADNVPKREDRGVTQGGVSVGCRGDSDGRHFDKSHTPGRLLRDDHFQRGHQQRVHPGDSIGRFQRPSPHPQPRVR